MTDAKGPFHEGERFVQLQAGAIDIADQTGGMILDRVTSGSRGFLARQRFLVAATEGADGAMWASPIFGDAGFADADETGHEVLLDLERTVRSPADRGWSDLSIGDDIGLLAIDLATRRRLRINGVAAVVSQTELRARVRETYPNCPKYISRRQLAAPEAAESARNEGSHVRSGDALDTDAEMLIGRSDTMFVASRHPARGADVSHRGGAPGFVAILGARDLRIPDYPGNNMFNTLGNLLVHRKAGLTFFDFARRRVLQMTGLAAVRFDLDDRAGVTGGTQRFLDFAIHSWTAFDTPAGWSWEMVG